MPDAEERALSDEMYLLWILIAQTKDAMLKARERDYARYGISNERRAVLWIIENAGGQTTPVDISRSLFRELHSVTELLKRMENDGLIERFRTSGRSRMEVRLTPAGREVFTESINNETDQRIMTALSKEERRRLASCLWKLRGQALRELGVPEWHFRIPLNPNEAPGWGVR